MYRVVFIVIFSLILSHIQAQEERGFAYFDSLTYRQYNEARWSELTDNSREAINHGYDYYYMRMRLGISLFERGSYLRASSQFSRAMEFNMGDPVATEYLYYCYLNSGRWLTANAVSEDFSSSLRNKTGTDKTPINRVSIDMLFSKAISQELVLNYNEVPGYGEQGNLIIPVYLTNTGIAFSKKISERVYLTHAYTYLRRASKLSYNDGTYYYDQFDQNLNQFQLYMSLAVSNKRGLTITPSLHYLNIRYPLLSFSSTGMNARTYSYNVTDHNFVSTLNLMRNTGLIDLGLEASYAYMNSANNLQARGILFISPLGNNKLYFGGSMAFKAGNFEGGWDRGLVYNGIFGFNMGDRIALALSSLYGDLSGYIDSSGFIVYNMLNDIDYSLKTDLSISVGKSGTVIYLSGRYGSEYTCFIPDNEPVSTTLKENYKSISILGGVSWEF